TWTADRLWQASLRGRLGYAWDRWLVYGTGGIAFTGVEMTSTFTATTTLGAALAPIAGLPIANGTTSYVDRQLLVRGTIGGGCEYAYTDKLRVGAEYRFTHYSQKSFTTGGTPAGAIPSTAPGPVTLSLDTHQIVARVSYMFGRL